MRDTLKYALQRGALIAAANWPIIVVQEVAADQQILLFDFADVMPQEATYWADGRHVNEAGALVKARLFAEYIHDQGLIDQ